jgi:Tol biopolymer transport system component
MMARLLCLFCFLSLMFPIGSHAVLNLPLVGPLVAVTPARQDEIRLHDIGTGETRTLSFGYGEHHVWGFSPDGCRILFTVDSSDIGLPILYTANLDGTNVQSMALYGERLAGTWGAWEPSWSSQNRIAFTLIREDVLRDGGIRRDYSIAVIDGNVPNTLQIYSTGTADFSPQWSPDGQWLAYVTYEQRVPGSDLFSTAVPTIPPQEGEVRAAPPLIEEADLAIISAEGTNAYRLTDFPVGSMRSPRWSPDSELIGFVYSPSPNNDVLYMIANRQGALATQLSYEWNTTLDLTWKPDSSAMVAAVRNFREMPVNRLWTIPLIGNADESAELFIAENAFSYMDYPRFSPDGRYIAFRSDYALIVYDLVHATWQRLDESAAGHTPPVWSSASFAGEANCP